MNLTNGVSSVNNNLNVINTKETVESKDNNAFSEIYNSLLGIYEDTNTYQNLASQAQLDFATGKTDDMLSVMMAQEKAYASLNYAVQVTNKVVESYREIMRIQL